MVHCCMFQVTFSRVQLIFMRTVPLLADITARAEYQFKGTDRIAPNKEHTGRLVRMNLLRPDIYVRWPIPGSSM